MSSEKSVLAAPAVKIVAQDLSLKNF